MPRRSPRGFTLIELMVALGMALAITTAAVSVMVLAVRTQQSGIVRNELARNAQLIMDSVSRDLSYLGAGVPRGFEGNHNGTLNDIGLSTLNAPESDLNALADKQLRPPIRIGRADYIAFLGDAPYPNADINGIAAPGMFKADVDALRDDKVQITSELSPCGVPKAAGDYECDSRAASFVRNLGGNQCTGAAMTEPTCPWGLGKWQNPGGSVQLLFSAVDGSWYRRSWDMSSSADEAGRTLIHLDHSPSATQARLFIPRFQESGVGGGMVATLDRIFYSLEQTDSPGTACGGAPPCTLWRKQCWGWGVGGADPDSASFPAVGGTVGRSTTATYPSSCTAPNQGTPWEKVMDGIKDFQIRYYKADALGTPLTAPLSAQDSAAARVIEVEVVMGVYIDPDGDGTFVERPGRDGALLTEHRMVRRLWLENAGGLVTFPNRTAPALGGCAANPLVPNECSPQ